MRRPIARGLGVPALIAALLSTGSCHYLFGDYDVHDPDATLVDAALVDAGPGELPDSAAVDGAIDATSTDLTSTDLTVSDAIAGDAVATEAASMDTSGGDLGASDALPDHAAPDSGTADAYGPNLIFVTAATYTIGHQVRSPVDGDELCNQAASAAGLPGDYRAWLSGQDRDVGELIVASGARGWARTDGTPFADTIEGLLAGVIYHPPNLDEHGRQLGGYELVTTNTRSDGTSVIGAPCDGWQQDEGISMLVGLVHATHTDWTDIGFAPCTADRHLYCLGVDRAVAVELQPRLGRVVFVSSGAFNPVGGYGGADLLCQSEAQTAGLQNHSSFKALLGGTDQGTAKARFTQSDEPWVRPDGVMVASTFDELFATYVLAPLNATAELTDAGVTYLGKKEVWTGSQLLTLAPSPDAGRALFCEGWSVADAGATGVFGLANHVNSRRFNSNYPLATCDQLYRVYCLEDVP